MEGKKLSAEYLDDLFISEISTVTDIVEKLSEYYRTVCTRWFNKFHQSPIQDKFARNCMLLLMHKQLNDKRILAYPFTDEQCFQTELIPLHKVSMPLLKHVTVEDEVLSSDVVHFTHEVCVVEVNKQLFEQNAVLKCELKSLKAEKQLLLQRMPSFHTKIKLMHSYDETLGNELSEKKCTFEITANAALELLTKTEPTLTEQPQFFVTLLKVLCVDRQDMDLMEQLDIKLLQLIQEHVDYNMRSDLIEELGKERERLIIQYKTKISENNSTNQKKRLLVKAMVYIKLLRRTFLESFNGDGCERKAAIKYLDQEYEDLAQQM